MHFGLGEIITKTTTESFKEMKIASENFGKMLAIWKIK